MSGPPVVCVVGRKDSGKTTVAVELVRELQSRGLDVSAVKHGHGFELDRPGTDSWRLRKEGGARRVLMAGPEEVALLGRWGPHGEPSLETLVERFLADGELVVAEGYKRESFPKIEVFRSAAHREPLFRPDAPEAATWLAVVTDAPDAVTGIRTFALSDPELAERLADLVVEEVL